MAMHNILQLALDAENASGVPEYRVVVSPLPRLYIYDHCRFCTRARMIFGLKGIKHELIFMANDDFLTPMQLVGTKMVPILSYKSEHSIAAAASSEEIPFPVYRLDKDGSLHMAESMDIVKQIDTDASLGAGAAILNEYEIDNSSLLIQWASKYGDVARRLLYPRIAKCTSLGEFAFRRCVDMFIARHGLGTPSDYDANMDLTSKLIPMMNQGLNELAENFANIRMVNETTDKTDLNKKFCPISIYDFDLWSRLRVFSIIKGIEWPAILREYLLYFSYICDIPLHDQIAI